jgi:hypothetical protein
MNHSELKWVNELAAKAGSNKLPFMDVEPLGHDTGERFFSEYLIWMKETKPTYNKQDLCLCVGCEPTQQQQCTNNTSESPTTSKSPTTITDTEITTNVTVHATRQVAILPEVPTAFQHQQHQNVGQIPPSPVTTLTDTAITTNITVQATRQVAILPEVPTAFQHQQHLNVGQIPPSPVTTLTDTAITTNITVQATRQVAILPEVPTAFQHQATTAPNVGQIPTIAPFYQQYFQYPTPTQWPHFSAPLRPSYCCYRYMQWYNRQGGRKGRPPHDDHCEYRLLGHLRVGTGQGR